MFMDCAATENGVFLLARTTKRCCGRSSLATLREVCHALEPYGAPRNDGLRCGVGDPLTAVSQPRDDREKRELS
ncbi:MAG: hypothetical protein NC218_11165 [Acetobacter sp.]|nr:hypothetical protein [Acetobacter sp.]